VHEFVHETGRDRGDAQADLDPGCPFVEVSAAAGDRARLRRLSSYCS
jgi:hypothetical protein